MICPRCDLAHADCELEMDGVIYILCSACAARFDHPTYTADEIVRQLKAMDRRHQDTNRKWANA